MPMGGEGSIKCRINTKIFNLISAHVAKIPPPPKGEKSVLISEVWGKAAKAVKHFRCLVSLCFVPCLCSNIFLTKIYFVPKSFAAIYFSLISFALTGSLEIGPRYGTDTFVRGICKWGQLWWSEPVTKSLSKPNLPGDCCEVLCSTSFLSIIIIIIIIVIIDLLGTTTIICHIRSIKVVYQIIAIYWIQIYLNHLLHQDSAINGSRGRGTVARWHRRARRVSRVPQPLPWHAPWRPSWWLPVSFFQVGFCGERWQACSETKPEAEQQQPHDNGAPLGAVVAVGVPLCQPLLANILSADCQRHEAWAEKHHIRGSQAHFSSSQRSSRSQSNYCWLSTVSLFII